MDVFRGKVEKMIVKVENGALEGLEAEKGNEKLAENGEQTEDIISNLVGLIEKIKSSTSDRSKEVVQEVKIFDCYDIVYLILVLFVYSSN